MRIIAATLACVLGSLGAAHAAPGSRVAVDLSLRPSALPDVEGTQLDFSPPAQQAVAHGQYVGPIWVEGVYARPLEKLPRQMRAGMARPVGPSVTVVESLHLGAGAGPGMYARF